jgi:hypothetical protein
MRAGIKALGAVARMEEERLATLDCGYLVAQTLDLWAAVYIYCMCDTRRKTRTSEGVTRGGRFLSVPSTLAARINVFVVHR